MVVPKPPPVVIHSHADDGFCNEYEKAPVGLHRIPEFDGRDMQRWFKFW